MEIIIGGRGIGKTHQLVEMAVKEKLQGAWPMIMVATVYESELCRDKVAARFQEEGLSPATALRFADSIVHTPNTYSAGAVQLSGVYVDGLGSVLARLLGVGPAQLAAVADNALVRTPQGLRFETSKVSPFIYGDMTDIGGWY